MVTVGGERGVEVGVVVYNFPNPSAVNSLKSIW